MRTEVKQVDDGGVLIYHEDFLAAAEANSLLSTLRETIAWKQEYGRFRRPFPRLTALYGDGDITYTYSGVTYPTLPWTPELDALRRCVEDAAKASFNSLLLNRYRDGRDSMGFHSDNEPELGSNPIVPSVSLGAPRRFVLRHKGNRTRLEYLLGHGSLLIMAGTLQHFWEHALPKTTEPVGERINLTFRRIIVEPCASA